MAGREHAAPRLAQEGVVVLDAEVAEEVVELVQEELLRPERSGIARLLREVRRVPVPELVVEHDGDPVDRAEIDHGQDVVVRGPRPTVDGDDWRLVLLEIPVHLIPCLAGLSCSCIEVYCAGDGRVNHGGDVG